MADEDNSDATLNFPNRLIESGTEFGTKRPERIGRYRVERVLGKGGFGLVYLAHDEHLDRRVAIKVPHARLISKTEDAKAYLIEARTVANLDHPHIVPVHDVGSTDECPCYVVSKYIEGTDLATRLKQRRLTYAEAAELVATVAEALHYAHKQGLVHRDVKPGNILIDADGKPFVVDFGLALREENVGKGPKYAGTPAYMSPEQARSEGHRVDGRSDVFSLGVVFYELLVGRQPFRGDTQAELLEQVTIYEPRPLLQYDERLPKELQRICFKALAKRASERYSSAHEMAQDLRHFLSEPTPMQSSVSPGGTASVLDDTAAAHVASTSVGSQAPSASSVSSDSQPLKIVPKGLRSFDAQDADFFLELLPGPRDRDGLPDSLRFWKSRVEEADPDNTFSVGLIYGPSGCGKSSLVKAGLLPRLSRGVIPIYIEATPDETETRLLGGLRKRCPGLEDNLSLKETLAALRRGQGLPVDKKVLIVLDQFEQCLHAQEERGTAALVQALRQCDGGRVQCIVMVRDDFWLAVSRFFRDLEVRLLDGHNIALADLFDLDHARKVLAAFGRAFGKLPDLAKDATREQKDFLKQSVGGLAEEGKVVCVRLALFAEMMKGREWTSAALREVGGTQGVGVTFLEETFSSAAASPEHRYHQKAARAVLKALLPESGADIKGQMKPYEELLEASGYAKREKDFQDLIRLLDAEIRLITPTDPAGLDSDDDSVLQDRAGRKFYQLTHDYLVPALREWLTRKKKETRRGRAELRLAERSAWWHARPENRHLPSWWENLNIRLFTDKKTWTEPQRQMMRIAGRVHGIRTLVAAILVVVAVVGGMTLRRAALDLQARSQAEKVTARAEGLVDALLNADIAQVPGLIAELEEVRQWANPRLREKIKQAADGSPQKLHLALALLPVDQSQTNYLREQLPVCTLGQFGVVRDALVPHQDKIVDSLWQAAQSEKQNAGQRFQALAALAAYSPEDERWSEAATFVANHLTSSVPEVYFGDWLKHFRGSREQLNEPLKAILKNRANPETQRETAALALADYLKEEPRELALLLPLADEFNEYSPLIAPLELHAEIARQQLLDELRAAAPANPTPQRLDSYWTRQSIAAVALVHLGSAGEVWPLLKLTPEPSLRSNIIHYLGKLRADHNRLAAQLEVEADASIRRALIQALGGKEKSLVPPADRKRLAEQLQSLFVNDADPGIHGAVSWTLRQWGEALPLASQGEPALSDEQKQRIAVLAQNIEQIQQRIAAREQELPLQQAAWERPLRESPRDVEASLRNGLIAHYPLDETAGLETASAVEGQPGGVYQGPGPPAWIPGVIGRALQLDGRGGHINCGDVSNPERTDVLSWSGWFFVEAGSFRGALIADHSDQETRGYAINIDPRNDVIFAEWNHLWPADCLSVSAICPGLGGRWHHVYVSYDGQAKASGVRIFLDGQRLATDAESDRLTQTIANTVPLHIGRRSHQFPFRGRIDDVRIHNRLLTDREVQQLYELGLQSLAQVPLEQRTADQQALLAAAFRLQDQQLQRLAEQLAAEKTALRNATWRGVRRWYVNSQGQTMAIIQASADNLSPSYGFLQQGAVQRIDHSFAIASHEVTVAEFLRFRATHRWDKANAPSADCPVQAVTWYDAAAYCNWLSEKEGLPEDQWVYLPIGNIEFAENMRIKANPLTLLGYRLPTEAEWEYACRAGTRGSYSFGEPLPLLGRYAHFVLNSADRSSAVESLLPNDEGLFDMHGNVSEWTQNTASALLFSTRMDVLRGGLYSYAASHVRSISRHESLPTTRSYGFGFRPVRTIRLAP